MFRENVDVVQSDIDSILQEDLPWEKLSGKHVYLTGASGMIGTYLALVLLNMNKRISMPPKLTLLARNVDYLKDRIGPTSDDCCCILEGDLLNIPESRFGSPDVVIHAASPASPKNYALDPVGVIRANVCGTLSLLEKFARNKKIDFLFLSSAVYGSTENDGPVAETTFGAVETLDVRNCYIESKRMVENILASWRVQYGLNFGIGRIFHTFGPGLNIEDGRIFSDVMKAIVNGDSIKLTSNGNALRAFCYLADTVSGLFFILLKGDGQSAYNVGNPDNETSILNFAITASKLRENVQEIEFISCDRNKYLPAKNIRGLPNVDLLRTLGWSPRLSIKDSLQRTYLSLVS